MIAVDGLFPMTRGAGGNEGGGEGGEVVATVTPDISEGKKTDMSETRERDWFEEGIKRLDIDGVCSIFI